MDNNKSISTMRQRSFSTTTLTDANSPQRPPDSSQLLVLGTSFDMKELSVRGQKIMLHTTNPIFQYSKRLEEELKAKQSNNAYIYLDMCPTYLHIIISYCKFLKDLEKYNTSANQVVKCKFVSEYKENSLFIISMVYLEIDSTVLNDFVSSFPNH